jgi:hypothetical protein
LFFFHFNLRTFSPFGEKNYFRTFSFLHFFCLREINQLVLTKPQCGPFLSLLVESVFVFLLNVFETECVNVVVVLFLIVFPTHTFTLMTKLHGCKMHQDEIKNVLFGNFHHHKFLCDNTLL